MILKSIVQYPIIILIIISSLNRLIYGSNRILTDTLSSEPTQTPVPTPYPSIATPYPSIATPYPSIATPYPSIATVTDSPTPLPSDASSSPTYIPSHPFAAVVNGGFESDVIVVEASGGSLSILPTGWTSHKSTILVSYSTDENYRQDDSGEVFLSVSSVDSGYVEQVVYACPGISLTLSFDATVFRDCQECSAASFTVYVDSTAIFFIENTPQSWQQYHGTFTSPDYDFELKFQTNAYTASNQYFQLFLDNINLTPHGGSCSPTSVPTVSFSPSRIPTYIPTTKPTYRPTSAYPTSEEVVLTVEGRLSLKHISYHDQLNSLDLQVLREVLSDIMHIGSRNVHGFTKISMVNSKRIDDEDVALIFNVEIMAGRHNVTAFDFGLVFNETRGYLWIATEETDIFLSRLAMALETVNGTSLGVYSVSTVAIDYFRLGDGVHSLQESEFFATLTVALLAGLFGFILIFIVYTVVMRMVLPKKIRSTAEEEKMLMDMGGRSTESSYNPNFEPNNVINWESSHSDLSTSQKSSVTPSLGYSVTQRLMSVPGPSERSFETPAMPPRPSMDRSMPGSVLSSSMGKSLGGSTNHSYEYEDENDGKFYSAYASKKKGSESKGPTLFERIDTVNSHSAIPELQP